MAKRVKRSDVGEAEDQSIEELAAKKESLSKRLAALGGAILNARPGKAQDDVREGTPHWDYVLKEMVWMHKDFKEEAKWKEQQQKRFAKSAMRGREKMFNRDMQNSKLMRQTARKLCTRVSREVRAFWDKIDRVVVYKYKTEFQARQQAAMDRHLDYLVSQTERYSNMLADKLKGADSHDDEPNRLSDSGASSPSERHSGSNGGVENGHNNTTTIKRRDPPSSKPQVVSRSKRHRVNLKLEQDDYSVARKEEHDEGLHMKAEQDVTNTAEEVNEAIVENKVKRAVSSNPKAANDPPALNDFLRAGEEYLEESDDEDWESENGLEEDDEKSMEDEDETKPEEVESELKALKREAEMSREDLLAEYGGALNGDTQLRTWNNNVDEVESVTHPHQEEENVEEEEEEEWNANILEEDDEGSMNEEDETRPEDIQNEIKTLELEANMTREELLAMYGNALSQDDEQSDDEDWNVENVENRSLENDEAKQVAAMTGRDLGYGGAMGESDDSVDDEEWSERELEEDDEEGMEQEDETKPEDVDSEIEALKREAEMSREELLALYEGAFVSTSKSGESEVADQGAETRGMSVTTDARAQNDSAIVDSEYVDDDDDDNDWDESELEEDDEGTIENQDETAPEDVQNELDLLKREAEISREELIAMYRNAQAADLSDEDVNKENVPHDEESSREESDKGEGFDNEMDQEGGKEETVTVNSRKPEIEDEAPQNQVPFLISKEITLREYQRAGLDWLVSMWGRRLNGILADEMGLGKTLQTITLLAHLASERGIWGPHLIVVPTSVLLNWEMEFKKFCPGFKILTYYGTAKDRKLKRTGWTKPNSFHVCITSYQLAVQDANILKRKKWYYLILDEAHNIKNFRSQRWQTLLNFNTKRRLLLTGTPLQNSLMELWSLMHFLMPHIFRSQSEFKYWFSNPLNAVVEGKGKVSAAQAALARQEQDKHYAQVIRRLHTVMRPFLLRRLKADVATQLPGKFEHIVHVPLSRRQRFLYEDFISRGSTRTALTSGGYLGMMAILMKLRMVCNHPDIFEPRVIESPLNMSALKVPTSARSFLIRKRFSTSFQGKDPITGLALDIGGQYGFATREAIDSPGLIRSKSEACRVAELSPSKAEIIQVIRSVDFEDGTEDYHKFKTFDDSFLEKEALAAIQLERRNLLESHFVQRAEYVEQIQRRGSNLERLAPLYGVDLRHAVVVSPVGIPGAFNELFAEQWIKNGTSGSRPDPYRSLTLRGLVRTMEERVDTFSTVIEHFAFITPKARAPTPVLDMIGTGGLTANNTLQEVRNCAHSEDALCQAISSYKRSQILSASLFHVSSIRLSLAFPDKMLVQYDCGKLQVLAEMLRNLKAGGHRVLIFTQMTRMLDILEIFLNIHGHVYFRLDGSTKVDERQRMMEKFNRDTKIFAFILSTRSGGLGINLTGADTVIFYDSDWNPSMDAQAQDRAHRIGQTRDVHIYRLVSEHTIEENILTKANQKRELNKLSVEDGKFTVSSFLSSGGKLTELIGVADDPLESGHEIPPIAAPSLSANEIEAAMASVEDESDKLAAKRAQDEVDEDMHEFDEIVVDSAVVPESPTPSVVSHDTSASLAGSKVKKPKKKSKNTTSSQSQEKDSASAVQSGEQQEASDIVDPVNMALTQDQFQEIEKQLRPVEQYSIVLRTYWYPIVNTAQAEVELAEMERTQQATWEMDRLEEEKELMEDEGEEELIMATDGKRFDVRQYLEAQRAIKTAKVQKLLSCSAWETHLSRDGRRYYWSRETGESTWVKPNILRAIEDTEKMRDVGWAALNENVLVRIFQLASSPTERMDWGRVCKTWRKASQRPELYLWVCNASDPFRRFLTKEKPPQFEMDWMSIGTWVEALYDDGEVWYPCMISDVLQDGTYQVTYTDGYIENGLRRSMLRLDSGTRYNFVNPLDGSPPYGVFNKYHASLIGCGPLAPDPRLFISLEEALEMAHPGDVIVLRAGLHKVSSLSVQKRVTIIGERTLYDSQGLIDGVQRTIAGEYDPGGVTGPVNPRVKQTGVSKAPSNAQKPTPPPPVEVIGIEAGSKDHLTDRHVQRMLEMDLCNLEIRPRVAVAGTDEEKEEHKHNLWSYSQFTGLEFGGMIFEGPDCQAQIRGLFLFSHRSVGADEFRNGSSKVDPPVAKCIYVLDRAKLWIDDCTINHLHGEKSAIVMEGVNPFLLVTHSTITSAPLSGIELREGRSVILESSICRNGQNGVNVEFGSARLKRSFLFGNVHGISISPSESSERLAKLSLEDCDLTDNRKTALSVPKNFDKSHFTVKNSILNENDKFDPDPWEGAAGAARRERTVIKARIDGYGAESTIGSETVPRKRTKVKDRLVSNGSSSKKRKTTE